MTSIPNQLNITINTSIPGSQSIKYKPSMTIKNISKDDTAVLFDPLIKLNQSKINTVPEDLRKKQFFNKGLFESLKRHIGVKPFKSLIHATNNGVVDNNIKITLKTIFDDNSVIYIGDKPYVIADFQWTDGNWKIDTKQKRQEIDSSKITNPYLKQMVMNEEIASGESELEKLPEALVYGPNYTGYREPKPEEPKKEELKTETALVPIKMTKETETALVPIKTTKETETALVPTTTTKETETALVPITNSTTTESSVVPYENNKVPRLALERGVDERVEELTTDETDETDETGETGETSDEAINSQVIKPINKMVYSNSSLVLRNYFLNKNYYYLINSVYINSDENGQKFIKDSLKKMVTVDIKEKTKNLSISAYKYSVESIDIVKNSGGGDCFFIAVSDGINHYNYYNQNNRIISGIYGKNNNLFTPKYLRGLVYDFIESLDNIDDLLKNIAPLNAHMLNDIFRTQLKKIEELSEQKEVSSENYIDIAKEVYKSNNNFLVNNIINVPIHIDDYYSPFKPITKNYELKNYILSSEYWANHVAIEALCKKLNLNIITIEKAETISIPFALLKQGNNCNKYMFLYYKSGHFELVTFKYKYRQPKLNSENYITGYNTLIKRVTIFQKTDMPPIYMMFLIYGSYYCSLDSSNKEIFAFYKNIMILLDNLINNKILKDAIISDKFKEIFTTVFPNTKNVSTIGGAITSPYSKTIYPRTVYPTTPIKKKDETSKLAYQVTIDMQLYPGTSIPPEELKKLKCTQKWNSVQKSWSELTGKPYVIKPVYNQKTVKNKEDPKNKTEKNGVKQENETRKNKQTKGGQKTKKRLF